MTQITSKADLTEAELAELERVYLAATEGPCEARYMQDAIPVACVHFGVVSLSQGVETGRMWQRDDAELYAAMHNAIPRLLATIRNAREACAKVADRLAATKAVNNHDPFIKGCRAAYSHVAAEIRMPDHTPTLSHKTDIPTG